MSPSAAAEMRQGPWWPLIRENPLRLWPTVIVITSMVDNNTVARGPVGDHGHQRMQFLGNAARGVTALIAIHDTTRGPALGDCRVQRLGDQADPLADALRLRPAMDFKIARADLPFGGAQAVILQPRAQADRAAVFACFGRAVESAGGRCVTMQGLGCSREEMQAVAEVSRRARRWHHQRLPGKDGMGVSWSSRRPRSSRRGSLSPDPLAVVVQGRGAGVMMLCAYLAAIAARLRVADVGRRLLQARERYGATLPVRPNGPERPWMLRNADTVPECEGRNGAGRDLQSVGGYR